MKRRGPGPHPQTQLHISWTFKDKVNPLYPNGLWIPQPELWKHILPRGGRTLKMSWWVPSPASAFHSIRLPQHLDAFPKAPHPWPGAWGRGRRKQAREVNHLVLPSSRRPPHIFTCSLSHAEPRGCRMVNVVVRPLDEEISSIHISVLTGLS